jgi:hypothetical protein
MKNQTFNLDNKVADAALSVGKSSPFLQLAQSKGFRKNRIALPTAPRPQLCPMSRSVRKEMRTAELAFWEATGGDYFKSSVRLALQS